MFLKKTFLWPKNYFAHLRSYLVHFTQFGIKDLKTCCNNSKILEILSTFIEIVTSYKYEEANRDRV